MKTKRESRTTARESFAADAVLREIWRIRDEMSASYDYDIGKLFASLRERERKSGHRVIDLSHSYPVVSAEPACVRESPPQEGKK